MSVTVVDEKMIDSDFKPIPQGSRMLFQQSAAPTGWTKEVSAAFNDATLKFTTGNVTTGGSVTFVNVFKNQSVSVNMNGSVEPTTLSINHIPSHKHIQAGGMDTPGSPTVCRYGSLNGLPIGLGNDFDLAQRAPYKTAGAYTSPVGSSSPHTHRLIGVSGTTSLNLSVKYAGCIIATKD